MTDHSQLVKHARFCANGFGSPKGPTGDYGLFDQLADAIEALQAERDMWRTSFDSMNQTAINNAQERNAAERERDALEDELDNTDEMLQAVRVKNEALQARVVELEVTLRKCDRQLYDEGYTAIYPLVKDIRTLLERKGDDNV